MSEGRGSLWDDDGLGSPVHLGDRLLLRSAASSGSGGGSGQSHMQSALLCLYDGAGGAEARLVPPERIASGQAHWQVGGFGCPPVPVWIGRPYLSGQFLLTPPQQRTSGLAQQRAFPGRLPQSAEAAAPALGLLPAYQQRLVLVREVLIVLAGGEGSYVRVAAARTVTDGPALTAWSPARLKYASFAIDADDAADRCAVGLAQSLLPMCEHALTVREFVSRHSRCDFGLVSHCLAASVRALLRELDARLAQLESLLLAGRLGLQKLIFLLQPAGITLRTLYGVCGRLSDLSGGQLLDGLHAGLLQQGDSGARQLYSRLLDDSSRPFFDMLDTWLFSGELSDPYKEFMIAENSNMSREALVQDFNAQYWEEHWALREKHVPSALRPHVGRALTAGKYLNVVRGCLAAGGEDGGVRESPEALFLPVVDDALRTECRRMRLDADGSSGVPRLIDAAYALSSRALLRLLEERHGLASHLATLRRFFLLEHGDFFIQFMDIAETELRRDVKEISLPRIQGLLQLAVQTSTLSLDPHRDDVVCALEPHTLIQHLHLIQSAGEGTGGKGLSGRVQGLKGVEALTLDYRVSWPVSIILSRRALTKYQLLSRLLFFSKYVELRVLGSWKDHQSTKALDVRAVLGPFFCLRHRMLHFLQNFVYYMTLEVISKLGHEMQQGLATAGDMDEVLQLHEKFLDGCLKECLLASHDLLNVLTKVMATCLVFSDHVASFTKASQAEAEAATEGGNARGKDNGARQRLRARHTECVREESGRDVFLNHLGTFERQFDREVGEFLEKLWKDSYRGQPSLSNLCVRLDYNGYYSGKLTAELGGQILEQRDASRR